MTKANEDKFEALWAKFERAVDSFHDKQQAATRTRSHTQVRRYSAQLIELLKEMYPPKTTLARKAKARKAATVRARGMLATHVSTALVSNARIEMLASVGVRIVTHQGARLLPKWAVQAANAAEVRRAKKSVQMRRALTAAYNLGLRRGKAL